MEFAERLKALRKRLKLSQADMGNRLKCSGNYIHLLEKGEKQPSDYFVERVDLVERGMDAIAAIESHGLQDNGNPYQTDLEWLIAHGHAEPINSIAKVLRSEFEKLKKR